MTGFAVSAELSGPRVGLGPAGPFPEAPLARAIDRRWLHYAFLSADARHAMVANSAWLGPDEPGGPERFTTILLLHDRQAGGWSSSQFNADVGDGLPWSAFRLPHAHGAPGPLGMTASAGVPAVALDLRRTSRPCTSQCAFFAGYQHLRWQSETGVRAAGMIDLGDGPVRAELIGYHERVRGRWGWPQLGEWVFGFANDMAGADGPPKWAGVFTFIRPEGDAEHATASFMLWKDGVMRRHFPRRNTSFAVRGELAPDKVTMAPPLAPLLGTGPAAPVPRRLAIAARQGRDWAVLDFDASSAARIVIPSENSLRPFSVHELVGDCLLVGELNGERFEVQTMGIVEFSGGAGGD